MSKPAEVSIPPIEARTKAAVKSVPLLRGPQASSYAVWPWTIHQSAGFFTAATSNVFFRQALADRRGSRLGVT